MSILSLLDKNNYRFNGVSDDELFCLVISIADHRLRMFKKCKTQKEFRLLKEQIEDEQCDLGENDKLKWEVEKSIIEEWFKRRVIVIKNYERKTHFVDLQKILKNFQVVTAYNEQHRTLEFTAKRSGIGGALLGNREIYLPIKSNISECLSKSDMKSIRKRLKLQESDGVGAKEFYSGFTTADDFIKEHRKVLRSLAKF